MSRTRAKNTSDFEDFFEPGKISRLFPSNKGNVFQANSPQSGVIEARLNGHNMALFKDVCGGGAGSRGFMNFQPQTMAGAMKKPLHASVLRAGLVTFPLEQLLDGAMHFLARHTRTHVFKCQHL